MAIPKFKPLENLSPDIKAKVKPMLIGLLVLLLGAFGYTAKNPDINTQMQESKTTVEKTAENDIDPNTTPSLQEKLVNIKRDAVGKFSPENCAKNIYNCDDFKYVEDAQEFYENCGGVGKDVNGLDRNKNKRACEGLPKRPASR